MKVQYCKFYHLIPAIHPIGIIFNFLGTSHFHVLLSSSALTSYLHPKRAKHSTYRATILHIEQLSVESTHALCSFLNRTAQLILKHQMNIMLAKKIKVGPFKKMSSSNTKEVQIRRSFLGKGKTYRLYKTKSLPSAQIPTTV